MGIDINIDIDFDEDEFRAAFADQAEEMFREWVENEAGDCHIECDCGSRSFDVETWTTANNALEGAAVCRECNERIPVELDTSDLDALR